MAGEIKSIQGPLSAILCLEIVAFVFVFLGGTGWNSFFLGLIACVIGLVSTSVPLCCMPDRKGLKCAVSCQSSFSLRFFSNSKVVLILLWTDLLAQNYHYTSH